ncbi:MAG: hypothetical protein ACREDL_23895 [Bradyrhizobium sp.]
MTSRRDLLASVAGAATLPAFGRRSEAGLAPTPSQPAGPFDPLTLPAHPGNDLLRVTGRTERAKGVVAYVGGRILDKTGRPIPGARVEIWQCDANGRYHNVDDGRDDRPLDQNFQGFGRTVTAGSGSSRYVQR